MAFLRKIAAANRSIFCQPTPRLLSTGSGYTTYDPISRRAVITDIQLSSVIERSDECETMWFAFPGLSSKQIKLSVMPNLLRIDFLKAENSSEVFEAFPPSVEYPFPSEAFKVNEIKAVMKDGLLQVIFPKVREDEFQI